MKKKGSHVGMILSFVIFITFIVFLYVVVSPAVNVGQDKKTVVEYVESKIIGNSTANLTSTSISINGNPPANCVIVGNFLVLLGDNIPTANIIIKNETGETQESYVYEAYLGPGINRKEAGNTFFKVYYSPEFNLLGGDGPGDCSAITDSNYTIGSVKENAYPFEKRIYEILNNYEVNYDALKKEWNIPLGNEFAFAFIQSNGTKVGVSQNISSTNVYVDEVPIQYVDRDANVQSGFIEARVW